MSELASETGRVIKAASNPIKDNSAVFLKDEQ